ncbi:MAG TPA: isoprenyl transferase [Candidatus Merdenecus merdavium]|nr:isoprenyl transferase [Candidatus Merdenecus merdavium]
MRIPNHVAIILDGNGRWAKSKGMPRNYGHTKGSKNLEIICEEAYKMGIEYLTVYAFSTENWNRSEDEVSALMKLLRNYMKTALKTAVKNNMKIRILGDISRLDQDLQDSIKNLVQKTAEHTGLKFQIAINYGGRDEIIRGIKHLAKDIKEERLQAEDINEDIFSNYLDTTGLPDPDLLIRTSGEMRLSNFLLWQLAYTEFYFADVHWPDFNKQELEQAIEKYNLRDRRFGGVREEK